MVKRLSESPNNYADRVREGRSRGEARCDICSLVWIEELIRIQDGNRVCPNCFEPNGGMLTRDKRRAEASARAAAREAGHQYPRYPYSLESAGGVFSFDPKPVELYFHGPDQTLTISGVNLSATSLTITYPDGITDGAAPVYAADGSSVVLTLHVADGTTLGLLPIYFDGVIWRDLIRVRGVVSLDPVPVTLNSNGSIGGTLTITGDIAPDVAIDAGAIQEWSPRTLNLDGTLTIYPKCTRTIHFTMPDGLYPITIGGIVFADVFQVVH